jgi:hypothetical protein
MGTKYRSKVMKESASKRLTMANGIKKPDIIPSKEHVEKQQIFGVVLLKIQVFWNMKPCHRVNTISKHHCA